MIMSNNSVLKSMPRRGLVYVATDRDRRDEDSMTGAFVNEDLGREG